MGALGVPDVRRWYERNWFATQNFHGHWYTDSDQLESLLHFRTETFEQALASAIASAPAHLRLAGHVPSRLVKRFVIKPLTLKPRGTMSWIDSRDDSRIRACFGSRAQWEQIGTWSTFDPPDPTRRPTYLTWGSTRHETPPRGRRGTWLWRPTSAAARSCQRQRQPRIPQHPSAGGAPRNTPSPQVRDSCSRRATGAPPASPSPTTTPAKPSRTHSCAR